MKALKLYGVEDLRYEDNEKPVIESANAVWSTDTIEIIHLRIYVDK
ncbi:TPA: hypothetical protein SMH89_000940 [Staphylococcus aureus]|nr:hypothetical protein [Staphylococcus aureus]